MSDKTEGFLRRRWKLILNIATVAALVVLAYFIRHQLLQTIENLFRVHAWILLLMLPAQFLDYHAQTKMYQHLFTIVGSKLKYWRLFRASLELNFINHVFPSGGVSGVSYFGIRMKSAQVTGTKATLVQVMKIALTILSFEILLIAGLFFLAIVGKANGFLLFIAGSLSTLLVIGTVAFTVIIGSKKYINIFFIAATKVLNWLIHLVRPHHPETINIEHARGIFDDLHENYMEFRKHYREMRAPFWWAFVANVAEVGTLYIVYIAFGHFVNVGAVILAYAVANFAGLVSVLPGGVGIYEGLMTAVLSAGGIPAGLSLPVTVMYRVINTLIQVPPGLYFYYHKTVQDDES